MPANFLPALKREIDELEAELASDPRFMKLQELRKVLALYEGEEAAPKPSATPRKAPKRQASEARERALGLALDFMLGQSDPLPTKVIYAEITKRGAELSGTNPMNNLSAMLSNSTYFDSQGRSGWLLSEEGVEQAWLRAQAAEQDQRFIEENSAPSAHEEDDADEGLDSDQQALRALG